MRSLSDVLKYSFENWQIEYGYNVITNNSEASKETVYMTVPLNEEVIEVPTFALSILNNVKDFQSIASLAVELGSIGKQSDYKSLDSEIRCSMTTLYSDNRLIRIPNVGNSTKAYYTTQGAIFDEKFNPIMLCTWELGKYTLADSVIYQYQFLRPLLRVAPSVFLNKETSVERYIINKIIPTVLSMHSVFKPTRYSPSIYRDNQRSIVEIALESMPFEIRKTDTPSISTTNRKLLDLALEHIDDIVQ